MHPSTRPALPGYQVLDTTNPDASAVDKRYPYREQAGDQLPGNLNCAYKFADTRMLKPDQEVICCRYLALMYCERTLKNPDFHPEVFFVSDNPREDAPLPLVRAVDNMGWYSSAWHTLPWGRFGEFLGQTFANLIERGTPGWSAYLVVTTKHMMSMRLRVEQTPDGGQELVVQVYDPNCTNTHTTARARTPQDWAAEPERYQFGAFIYPQSHTEMFREARVRKYCSDLDPQAHIAIFEWRTNAQGERLRSFEPCNLVTNWCTNGRVELLFAERPGNQAQLYRSLQRLFDDPAVDALANPTKLLEIPNLHRSVLCVIMTGDKDVGRAQWQACWEKTQDMDLKVHLLRGHDVHGRHFLRPSLPLNPDALVWWFGLAATLPASPLVKVLQTDDKSGLTVLEMWLREWADKMINPWPPVLDALRASRPDFERQLVESLDQDGTPLIARLVQEPHLPLLEAWGKLLPRFSEDDQEHLLMGQDKRGFCALYRAMAAHSPKWIEIWSQWWKTLSPPRQVRLLIGSERRGRQNLWALVRNYDHATMQAWVALWRQLPERYRASVLASEGEVYPFSPVLVRAMSGQGANPNDPKEGDARFIAAWGECVAELPAGKRGELLVGSIENDWPALWRGLETGHWKALSRWFDLLHLVSEEEREELTALTGDPDDPLARAVEQHARRDPSGYADFLRPLLTSTTIPERALAWLRARASSQ